MTKCINKIAIVGAGGHGKVVADLAEQLGYQVFFYDDCFPKKVSIENWQIIGSFKDLLNVNKDVHVVVAIGDNTQRREKVKSLKRHSFHLPTLIHPSAVVSRYSYVGLACVIFSGVHINAFAKIGDGCIINTAAVIEHDCLIDSFVHVCPNVSLAGAVEIGENTLVGIGSQVKQLVKIGSYSLIGAGSTVIKDVPDEVTVYGSPAVVGVS